MGTAENMILVGRGAGRYSWGVANQDIVSVGSWLSEAVLWTQWTHRGVCIAAEDCRCFHLNAAVFQQIVNQFELVSFDPTKYAEAFLKSLNSLDLSEVSDLPLLTQVHSRKTKKGITLKAFSYFSDRMKHKKGRGSTTN